MGIRSIPSYDGVATRGDAVTLVTFTRPQSKGPHIRRRPIWGIDIFKGAETSVTSVTASHQ
jgi:hypothetical protein